jgi:hypothetical protein
MTDYQPTRKTKRLPDSIASQPGASDPVLGDIPPALATALSEAEQKLNQRDKVYSILSSTHTAIPALLRQMVTYQEEFTRAEVVGTSTAEVQARVSETQAALAQARRQRAGATAALMTDAAFGQSALAAAKSVIESARQQFTQAVISEHRRRYDDAVAVIHRLQAEGDVLGAALRTPIVLPVPAQIRRHPNPDLDGQVERLEVAAGTAVSVPVGVTRVSDTLRRLDDALSLCSSVSRARDMTGTLQARRSIGLSESAQLDCSGVYLVVAESIRNPADLLEHGKNDLVDRELLGGDGPLQRSILARTVKRVDSGGPALAGAA